MCVGEEQRERSRSVDRSETRSEVEGSEWPCVAARMNDHLADGNKEGNGQRDGPVNDAREDRRRKEMENE